MQLRQKGIVNGDLRVVFGARKSQKALGTAGLMLHFSTLFVKRRSAKLAAGARAHGQLRVLALSEDALDLFRLIFCLRFEEFLDRDLLHVFRVEEAVEREFELGRVLRDEWNIKKIVLAATP